jgi:thioredoxin 2
MANHYYIICPDCDSINRVPADKLASGPKCGICGHKLMDGKPLDLTDKTFIKHISKNDIPVLVDFWAPWCGPCRMMAPAYKEAASELRHEVRFAKVNSDDYHQLSARQSIRGIPTLILFRKGKEVARLSGATDKNSLIGWLRRHI